MWIPLLSTCLTAICFHQVFEVIYLTLVLPFFSSSTSTLPVSSTHSHSHQQSATVMGWGVARSARSLWNRMKKLPYIEMAPVTLATSCPWAKRAHLGVWEAEALTHPVNSHIDFKHTDLCTVSTVQCTCTFPIFLWIAGWLWLYMWKMNVFFLITAPGLLGSWFNSVVQQVISSHEDIGRWKLPTFFCLPQQWQLNNLTSESSRFPPDSYWKQCTPTRAAPYLKRQV